MAEAGISQDELAIFKEAFNTVLETIKKYKNDSSILKNVITFCGKIDNVLEQ
jgi:hypothetical protein